MHDDDMVQSPKAVLQEHCISGQSASGVNAASPDCSVTHTCASKPMDAMPFCVLLQMNNDQYKPGTWNYLDIRDGLVNPWSVRSQCGTLMSGPDHPHTCVHLNGARMGQCDIHENGRYRGMQRAGMYVSKKSKN